MPNRCAALPHVEQVLAGTMYTLPPHIWQRMPAYLRSSRGSRGGQQGGSPSGARDCDKSGWLWKTG
jgi:hypothetical protein